MHLVHLYKPFYYSDNMRYSFRAYLLNLGFIGDEFKNYRAHLLKHLSGNIAWRHPEDAIAQRERLKAEREAARNERVSVVSSSSRTPAQMICLPSFFMPSR